MCSKVKNRGFTLLEILMAIAIFAIVLSTIFGAYTSTFRVTRIAESQGDIYRKARIAMERIIEDLAAIQVSAAPPPPAAGQGQPTAGSGQKTPVVEFVGEDEQIGSRAADKLRFTSGAHLVFSGRKDGFTTAVISYTVKEDDRGTGLLLLRADRPALVENRDDRDDDGLVLCDGLLAVDFTYRDDDGAMVDNWDSTTSDMQQRPVPATRLPAMISIRLAFNNEAEPEQPLLFMTNVLIPVRQAP